MFNKVDLKYIDYIVNISLKLSKKNKNKLLTQERAAPGVYDPSPTVLYFR